MKVGLIAMRLLAGGAIVMSMLAGCAHAALSTRSVPCVLTSFGASLSCYGTQDAPQSAGQLVFVPINPSPIVRSTTGLRLSSVILERPGLIPRAHNLPRARYIIYVFGTFPTRWGGTISVPVPARPRFLLVSESAPTGSGAHWHMGRVLGHLANGKAEYWPWNFWSASVNVKGNVPKRAIRTVGLRVLAYQSHNS